MNLYVAYASLLSWFDTVLQACGVMRVHRYKVDLDEVRDELREEFRERLCTLAMKTAMQHAALRDQVNIIGNALPHDMVDQVVEAHTVLLLKSIGHLDKNQWFRADDAASVMEEFLSRKHEMESLQ